MHTAFSLSHMQSASMSHGSAALWLTSHLSRHFDPNSMQWSLSSGHDVVSRSTQRCLHVSDDASQRHILSRLHVAPLVTWLQWRTHLFGDDTDTSHWHILSPMLHAACVAREEHARKHCCWLPIHMHCGSWLHVSCLATRLQWRMHWFCSDDHRHRDGCRAQSDGVVYSSSHFCVHVDALLSQSHMSSDAHATSVVWLPHGCWHTPWLTFHAHVLSASHVVLSVWRKRHAAWHLAVSPSQVHIESVAHTPDDVSCSHFFEHTLRTGFHMHSASTPHVAPLMWRRLHLVSHLEAGAAASAR
eukprot:PhM_4_TR14672/c6_g1_i3/m.87640